MKISDSIPNSIRPNKVWISEPYKLRFLGIPKCATTTVKTNLKMDNRRYIHDLAKGWHYDRWPLFAYFRDPATRFRSGCMEYAGRFEGRKAMGYDFMHKCIDRIESEGFFDEHILPQSFYCPKPEVLDYVFWVEEFNIGWKQICNMIGHSIDITFRRNEYPVNSPLPRIDVDLEKRIREVYKKDYTMWDSYQSHLK